MKDHSIKNQNDQFNMDPWDPDFYETGSTEPPKSYGSLVAVLLVLVILLCGVTSFLGLLNIRLFVQNNQFKNNSDIPISVQTTTIAQTEPTETTDSGRQPSASLPQSDSILNINQSPISVENIPQEGGLSLQEIYTNTIDSVVSIICTLDSGSSSGSGVVLLKNGYIVTNAHVVNGANTITVQLTDGRSLEATLVGSDSLSDLAVVHIQADDLIPAQFGDSSVLRVGDAVAAIGDPLGVELRGSMTPGIVSGLNRVITTGGRTMTLIQTDAALNSGNSGGPLLNCYGQVIGINTMKMVDSATSGSVEGIGFAIPSTTVKEIVDQLLQQGYVSGRPSLGITGEEIPSFYQRYYGFPDGMYITEVESGSNADLAGIEPGDVLVSMDGTNLISPDGLQSLLYSHNPGDTVELVIYRSRRYYQVTVTLEENRG